MGNHLHRHDMLKSMICTIIFKILSSIFLTEPYFIPSLTLIWNQWIVTFSQTYQTINLIWGLDLYFFSTKQVKNGRNGAARSYQRSDCVFQCWTHSIKTCRYKCFCSCAWVFVHVGICTKRHKFQAQYHFYCLLTD